MGIVESVVMALSLCADCFAVSLCSSVTLKSIRWKDVFFVAFSFALIQSLFLLVGWLFGNAFVGFVSGISHIIGFLLLLYVGGAMFVEGIRGEGTIRDLNGFRNVLIGGIATSIDALAVGVAQSMNGQCWRGFFPLLASVFVITAAMVVAGIYGGKTLGSRFGRWAEIAGGVVLIGIGTTILFS